MPTNFILLVTSIYIPRFDYEIIKLTKLSNAHLWEYCLKLWDLIQSNAKINLGCTF